VEYGFTADLEEKLDEVAMGDLTWKQLLRDFWEAFSAAIGEAKDLKVSEVITDLDEILGPHIFPKGEDGIDPRQCPSCGNGRLGLKLGRFGAFVGCSNYPECKYTRQLGAKPGDANNAEPRELGIDPGSGESVTLRSGRFGPYVQLGNGEKPKRSSIPKGIDVSTIDFEAALRLLSLPREVGKHPETGNPITANFGRYGPYVAHDGQYASLDSPDEVFTVGLNRAVSVLAEKKSKGRAPRGAQALKELGADPTSGAAIKLMRGRYGPYVSDGTTNATVRDSDPLSVTLEQALGLLAERAAKGAPRKKNGRAAKPKKANSEKAASSAKPSTAGKRKKTDKPKAEPVDG
jgi:DNA topoisomerase-1